MKAPVDTRCSSLLNAGAIKAFLLKALQHSKAEARRLYATAGTGDDKFRTELVVRIGQLLGIAGLRPVRSLREVPQPSAGELCDDDQ